MCWYVFGQELLCNSEPPPPEPQDHVSSYHIGRRCAVPSTLSSSLHVFGNNVSWRRATMTATATIPLASRNAAASSRLQSKQTTVGDWRNHTETLAPVVSSTEPFCRRYEARNKSGRFYAEWRWPSWARHGMAPTPPTARTKDHEARRPAAVDQRARARPR